MTNDFRLGTAVAMVVCSSLSAFLGAYMAVRLPVDNSRMKAPEPIDWESQSKPLVDTPELTDELMTVPDAFMEPGRLPESVPASALENRLPDGETNIRPLIEAELPDATDEEREIWYDELKELTPDAVRDILQLRKVLGESWETRVLRSPTNAPMQ